MRAIIINLGFILFTTLSIAQVGIGTTSPRSTLEINGNLSVKHLTLPETAGDTSTQAIDDGVYISIDAQVANQRFNLPDARLVPGRIYLLRNIQNLNIARIHAIGYDAITPGNGVLFFASDNSTGGTEFVELSANNNSSKTLLFISDGSNWTYGALSF